MAGEKFLRRSPSTSPGENGKAEAPRARWRFKKPKNQSSARARKSGGGTGGGTSGCARVLQVCSGAGYCHMYCRHLRAWNTQESIADAFGVDKSTVNRILLQIGKSAETQQDFTPPIYACAQVPGQPTREYPDKPRGFHVHAYPRPAAPSESFQKRGAAFFHH